MALGGAAACQKRCTVGWGDSRLGNSLLGPVNEEKGKAEGPNMKKAHRRRGKGRQIQALFPGKERGGTGIRTPRLKKNSAIDSEGDPSGGKKR